jgi:prepilin-type N-terminal cleavage/methylation domain-containing protein
MIRRARAHDSEGGYTLTEVLAALIILCVAITGIVSAMGSSIIASDIHRKLVTDDAIVRTYADRLNTAPYIDCATAATPGYSPAGVNMDLANWPGYSASVVSVEYGQGPGLSFGPSCSSDTGLQRIRIEAHSSTNRGKQTVQIVKRRP